MNDLELFRFLSELDLPVLTAGQAKALIGKGSGASAVRLSRMVKKGVMVRVMRGRYALPTTDPLCIASTLYVPSFVTLWAALRYHDMTTQSPITIDVMNTERSGSIRTDLKSGPITIRFIRTGPSSMFGYDRVKIGGHMAFIASRERAVIDGLIRPDLLPLEETIEAIGNGVDPDKAMELAQRLGTPSVTKRLGYLLEKAGFDVNSGSRPVPGTYVKLDPFGLRRGKYDVRWGILDNMVIV